MTLDELVAGVLGQGGFDVDPAMATSWLNEMYKTAVARSKWREETTSLGSTVVGQAQYDIPESVVDIVAITLDAGAGLSDWQRIGTTDLWDVKTGRQFLRGTGGVFAPAFGPNGEKRVELYPVPTIAGTAITALVAVQAIAMVSGSDVPILPEDMHGALMDGAIALGLRRMDERSDSASVPADVYGGMVLELSRRKNSRVGSRPSRMRLVR